MSWERHREVRGPDLRLWRLGRRWSLWRPRLRRVRLGANDAWNLSDLADDFSVGIAVTIVVFLIALLASPLAGLGVLFAEWMLVLLLVPVAVAYRVLFRRPWHVYAESVDGHDLLVASVAGWEASQQVIDEAVGEIKAAGRPQSPRWVPLERRLDE